MPIWGTSKDLRGDACRSWVDWRHVKVVWSIWGPLGPRLLSAHGLQAQRWGSAWKKESSLGYACDYCSIGCRVTESVQKQSRRDGVPIQRDEGTRVGKTPAQ